MFPLNRSVAIIGLFEVELPQRIVDRYDVAAINAQTALSAHRFVYSGEAVFAVAVQDGVITGRDEFVAMMQSSRSEGV
jgi:hypothetical protein